MPGDPPAAVIGTAEQEMSPQPAAVSTFDAVDWPVRTARLLLRPATAGDAEAAWTYPQLESVSYWLTGVAASFEEFRAVFEKPARLAKILIVELEGVVIGDLMLDVQDAWAQAEVAEQARGVQAELGWVFHPDYAGRGYATEAVRELIRICFTDLGLRRVTAGCFADNEASWRLMERVGMRREGYAVGDSLHRSGRWLDGMTYALLADEWRGVSSTEPDGDPGPGQPPS
ncbi:MAG TPA: GNAT family protein [Jatrophihabitans sp.]|jgi:RimJ/RimL family protein N-acetyltransferase|nr:GNAT family protein [Jatrophihabitans sp.]